jgi:hypothetical protein
VGATGTEEVEEESLYYKNKVYFVCAIEGYVKLPVFRVQDRSIYGALHTTFT